MAPFGLLPENFSNLSPYARPTLWRIADDDPNAFAVGDLVADSLTSIDGLPVASLALEVAGSPGQAGRSRFDAGQSVYGVVVAVAPGTVDELYTNFATPIVRPGVRSGPAVVWVLATAGHVFQVVGDASTPARGELLPTPTDRLDPTELSLHEEGVNRGEMSASLVYAPPLVGGGRSRTALLGSSFIVGSAGMRVLELASGSRLGPGALYRVRF